MCERVSAVPLFNVYGVDYLPPGCPCIRGSLVYTFKNLPMPILINDNTPLIYFYCYAGCIFLAPVLVQLVAQFSLADFARGLGW